MEESSPIDLLSTKETWRLFRIISETVDGFEAMSKAGPCVSIFGSARATPNNPLYKETEAISKLLVSAGFGIITGGGPGLMEAANKAAFEAGGRSIGLHIHLPNEEGYNNYLTIRTEYRYFFIRKLMFVKYAQAYVVMPGGMGTIDEFSEAFVLTQTKRIHPFPIILYDSQFWSGLVDWIRQTMSKEGFIEPSEVDDLLNICDTPEEVLKVIQEKVPIAITHKKNKYKDSHHTDS